MALEMVVGACVLIRKRQSNHTCSAEFLTIARLSSRSRRKAAVTSWKFPSRARGGPDVCCCLAIRAFGGQILPPDRSPGHCDPDRRRADFRLQPRILGSSAATAHGGAAPSGD